MAGHPADAVTTRTVSPTGSQTPPGAEGGRNTKEGRAGLGWVSTASPVWGPQSTVQRRQGLPVDKGKCWGLGPHEGELGQDPPRGASVGGAVSSCLLWPLRFIKGLHEGTRI